MKTSGSAVSVVLVSVMLLVLVMAFSVASAPADKMTASNCQTQRPEILSFYKVGGYVYEADGTTPVGGATVTVTNLNTGASTSTLTNSFGLYSVDVEDLPGGVAPGHIINVTATKDLQIGWNEGAFTFDVTILDITLSGVIPEFPSIFVPVLGLACLVVLSGRKRKGFEPRKRP